MRKLADGVWQLRGLPRNAFNAYLIEDVLIDARTRISGTRILEQLKGRAVSALALTHAHPDHQGAANVVCEKLRIPYWVGEKDVPWAEDPGRMVDGIPGHRLASRVTRFLSGPGLKVDRVLKEGDEVAGFRVLDVPGHSPGHVAFWRESDGVLVLGDVVHNRNFLTGARGLNEPPPLLAYSARRNRSSARRLAELEPRLMLFGHGPPLRDTALFVDFVDRMTAQSPARP